MSQDFQREIEKSEQRVQREIDFRMTVVTDALLVVKNRLDALEHNIDSRFDKLEDIETERRNWSSRFFIGVLVSFVFGSGAIGMIQFILSILRK